MKVSKVFLVFWPFLLAGCAPLAQTTLADVQNAQAIAVAVGDQQGAQCWGMLAMPLTVETTQSGAGVATLFEKKRALGIIANGPCAPLAVMFLADLAKLGVPGASLVLP